VRPSRLFYGFEAHEVCNPQPPIPNESLLSWIARTTIENELPNVTTIMRDVGQTHRNRVVDVMRKEIDVEGLSVILGGAQPILESMRSHDIGKGATRYLGSIIRTGDLHTRARRFAPATLADDDTPFYRASWLIRTFPVCTESWQTLRTTCQCGTEQTWAKVSSLFLCEGCGEDLRELPADTVPPEARPGLTFLADLLFGNEKARATAKAQLPPDLQVLDSGDAYELALLVARITDPTMPNPREKVWRRDPMRLALALSKAAELLPQWPRTPWLALEAAGDVKAMLPRCDALKTLYRVLCNEYAPNIAASIEQMLDGMRLAITLDCEEPPDHLVDLNDAEKILGTSKRTIRAARAAGHLECHFVIRRGEVLPGYSRAELQAMAKTRSWPSASVAAKRLGLPTYGVEQLCAMGELLWAKAPYRTLRPGLVIDPHSIDAFKNALRARSSSFEDTSDSVPLTRVMRGIGGREKPWGRVLQGLRSGQWRHASGQAVRAVSDIYVSRGDIVAIRALTFDQSRYASYPFSCTLQQDDACDILNVPLRSRYCIEPYRIGVRHGAWLFDRAGVADLAAKIVTSSELGARHLLEPKSAIAVIRRAGLTREEFGYRRQRAIDDMGAALLS